MGRFDKPQSQKDDSALTEAVTDAVLREPKGEDPEEPGTAETLELSAVERIEHLNQQLLEKDQEIVQLERALHQLEIEKNKLITAEPDRDLWYRANFDGLTGLPRKESYLHDSEKLLMRMLKERERLMGTYDHERRSDTESVRRADTLSVIVVDLDDFKMVNDTYGHAAGDRVLSMAAQVLRNAVREDEDVLGRFGGEELVVTLKNRPETRAAIAERIRSEIAKLVVSAKDKQGREVKIPITASVGVAKWQEDETFQDVFDHADSAMYSAKGSGKNRIWVYEGMEGQEPDGEPETEKSIQK